MSKSTMNRAMRARLVERLKRAQRSCYGQLFKDHPTTTNEWKQHVDALAIAIMELEIINGTMRSLPIGRGNILVGKNDIPREE